MKYLEWLKKELGEEKFNKLFPQGSEILKAMEPLAEKKILDDDGKLVPYSRFEEVNKKLTDPETGLTAVTAKLTKAQTDLEGLKAAKGNEAKTLEEKFQTLSDNYTKLEKSLSEKDQQIALNNKREIVSKVLHANKVNEDYLATAMREFEVAHPLDKLEIVDGQIKDADTIVKPFVEKNKIFFGEFKLAGAPPASGDKSPDFSQYENMTDAEYYAARAAEQKK